MGAVVNSYLIIEEQREQYQSCIDRQSVYCNADFEEFETTAREDKVMALNATAATYEVDPSALRAFQ